MARFLRDKCVWFLCVLGILYFHAPLFSERIFYFRDLILSKLQRKLMLSAFLKAGDLPLWNPLVNGGQSFLAYEFPLYPFNLLFWALPLPYASSAFIVLHIVLCSLFAYALAKALHWSASSCLLVGIIYGYCGWTLSHGNLSALTALPYLPLILACWHSYLQGRGRRWFLATVVVGVLQVLSGSPENSIIGVALMLGWTLCCASSRQQVLRMSGLWFSATLFILSISAIQILPTAEMSALSPRGEGLDYEMFSRWSLPPRRLPELIFPSFLGRYDTLSLNDCWGWDVIGHQIPFILSIYVGVPVFVLACLGVFQFGNVGRLTGKLRWYLAAAFLLCLVGSFGRFLPGFRLVYEYVPFVTMFRYPIKCLGGGILPLALLAGAGAELYFPSLQKEQSKTVRSLRVSSSLLMAAALLSAFLFLLFLMPIVLPSVSRVLHERYFRLCSTPRSQYGLLLSTGHAALISGFLVAIFRWAGTSSTPSRAFILPGVVALDLLWAGYHINPSEKASFFFERTPLISAVSEETEQHQGRFFRQKRSQQGTPTLKIPGSNEGSPHPNSIAWLFRWDLQTLQGGTSPYFWIPTIFEGKGGLSNVRFKKLRWLMEQGLSWEQKLSVLSTGAVRVVLSEEEIDTEGVTLIGEFEDPMVDGVLYLYRNERAASRASFVSEVIHAETDRKALRILLGSSFDPRRQVILHRPTDAMAFPSAPPSMTLKIDPSEADTSIKVFRKTNYKDLVFVATDREGFLVFAEPFYPGWTYSLDGQDVVPVLANYAFTAIPLPAGRHEVMRSYRPASMGRGLLISALGVVSLIALFWVSPRTRWRLL